MHDICLWMLTVHYWSRCLTVTLQHCCQFHIWYWKPQKSQWKCSVTALPDIILLSTVNKFSMQTKMYYYYHNHRNSYLFNSDTSISSLLLSFTSWAWRLCQLSAADSASATCFSCSKEIKTDFLSLWNVILLQTPAQKDCVCVWWDLKFCLKMNWKKELMPR